MKLIHCGDIHLDSAMEHNLSTAQAKERNAEICATFASMVHYAVDNQVDAVLIAGDLFDTDRVSGKTADFVMSQIRGAQTVEFFYLRGNHDEQNRAFVGLEKPENLHLFAKDWTYFRLGDVVIAGMEPETEQWQNLYDSLMLAADAVNIVMLHGQTGTQPGREMIALPKLCGRNIDYLALGHIHSYQKQTLDDRGCWCYCGCLEGRGFDECGEKGFVLLQVQNKQVQAQFVPFARRTLYEREVDITELTTISQLQGALTAAGAQIPKDALVKFTLVGSFTPETQKDLPFLRKMLEPDFYFVKIKDESRLKIEKESYEHDFSLKGAFIRMVMASDKTTEEKEQMILCGIQALSGEEVTL